MLKWLSSLSPEVRRFPPQSPHPRLDIALRSKAANKEAPLCSKSPSNHLITLLC